MKKYEFTEETKSFAGRTLHRIRAVRDFSEVKAGELGGFIETEGNLSHEGDAWVYGNARVSGDAWVYGNARVSGDAQVYGDARVGGNAWVSGNAWVYGDAWVSGDAQVYGDAWVSDNARISTTSHYLVVGPIRGEDGCITFYKTKDGLSVACDCFFGGIDAFSKKVKETHGDDEHAKAYQLAIELAKLRITPEAAP